MAQPPLTSERPSGRARLKAFLVEVGAPHWALLYFVLMALSSLGIIYHVADPTPLMWAPFGLLTLNLVASLLTRSRFRSDVPLLVFHLALLALVVLLALARATYLDAGATVSQGAEFEGQTVQRSQGPWHPGRLESVRFQNLGVVARFDEAGEYLGNDNRVRWQGLDGRWRVADIGDDRPLLLGGYRIYATVVRGLSARMRWEPVQGEGELGAVQLADHREVGDLRPSASWVLNNGPEVWMQLEFRDLPQKGTLQRDLGAQELDHRLVVRVNGVRTVLSAGQWVDSPQGRLHYLGLDSWMSYRFVYEPMVPWIVASIAVALLSLIWFYVVRVFRRPLTPD